MIKGIPLNAPNIITIGRIVSVPIVIILMLFIDDLSPHVGFNQSLSFISAMLFAIAMGSDMIDGYIARKYNLISVFGKLMDPLADKMLFIAAMIMMIQIGRIPAWLVALFFIREVGVTSVRAMAANEGVIISASHWGKYKSAFVSTATVGLLLHYPFFGINWKLLGWILLIPSLAFSFFSGIHYTLQFLKKVPLEGAGA